MRKPFQRFIQPGKNLMLDEMLDWFAPAFSTKEIRQLVVLHFYCLATMGSNFAGQICRSLDIFCTLALRFLVRYFLYFCSTFSCQIFFVLLFYLFLSLSYILSAIKLNNNLFSYEHSDDICQLEQTLLNKCSFLKCNYGHDISWHTFCQT